MKRLAFLLAICGLGVLPATASANVAQVGSNGFAVRHIVQVSASVEETWAVLLKPSVWWGSQHTWSGESANLTLDARPGGCFCEVLPNKASPKAAPIGGVEHMRVIYVERPRALRLVGALGPLQADATTATLTIQLKPGEKGGTQVLLEYVVGGYSRTPFDKLAPMIDSVLGEQVHRLSEKLGGSFAAAFPAPAAEAAPEPATVDAPAEPVPVDPAPIDPAPADGGVVPLSERPPSGDGTIVGR